MNAKLEFGFKKSFRFTSKQGKTIHWMKSIYGCAIDEAITNVVQLYFFPRVLAASPETWDEVEPEVVRSRLIFQERMELAKGTPPAEKPIPQRVRLSFSQSFERDSRKGRVFAWLTETYGDKAVNAIMDAVYMVYVPAALASDVDSAIGALREAECSRLKFENAMTETVYQTKHLEVPAIQPLSSSETIVDRDLENVLATHSLIPKGDSTPTEATAPEAIAEDDEEDYEPPDYGLDFGNNVGN